MNGLDTLNAVSERDAAAAVMGAESVNGTDFWALVGEMLRARRLDWVLEHIEDLEGPSWTGMGAYVAGACPVCGKGRKAGPESGGKPYYVHGGYLTMADETCQPCVKCFDRLYRARDRARMTGRA